MRNEVFITRRDICKVAALGAPVAVASGISLPGRTAFADVATKGGVQLGFLVDMSKCVGCRSCAKACRTKNHLSEDTPDRRRVLEYANRKRERVTLSVSCMHCGSPSCREVCPAGAITKGDAGIVSVDRSLCIGCKYCYQACPYDVPRYNSKGMDKCDFCLGCGISPGENPHCVRACKFDALRYGTVEGFAAEYGAQVVPIASDNDPSCYLLR